MTLIRPLIAVILGSVVCNAVFSLLALATLQLWPDYAVHAHRYLDQRLFTFPPIMACLNLLFWMLGYCGAGWTAARAARDNRAVWALAALMQVYAIYVHVLRSWSTFPAWYNLVIVLSVIPATWLGARMASSSPVAKP